MQQPTQSRTDEIQTSSNKKQDDKPPSSQRKGNKDIWQEDEVQEQASVIRQSHGTSGKISDTKASEDLLRQQENVAACENSNNINIENERNSASNDAVEKGEGFEQNAVSKRVEESEQNLNLQRGQEQSVTSKGEKESEENVTSKRCEETEQNIQNELKESAATEKTKKTAELSEEPEVHERPVYIQRSLPGVVAGLRETGNNLFRAGQYGDGVQKYTQAIDKLSKGRSQMIIFFAHRMEYCIQL